MGLFSRKNRGEDFVRRLQEDYAQQMFLSGKIKEAAVNARYKHYREKLLRVANEEEEQADLIKQMIFELNGSLPGEIPSADANQGKTFFEILNEALELDHDEYYDSYKRLYEAQDEGLTDFLPRLDRIRDQRAKHRETLLSILQTINPYQL
jgi:bacterioferritin (cytochrome b1)